MKIIALVVAGGDGNRFNAEVPKQFTNLNDITILDNTIKVFLSHKKIDKVQVVIGNTHKHFYQPSNEKKLLPVVFGGKRRQDSVCNGLEAIEKYDPEYVLIHDGVRPFVSRKLISRVIGALGNDRVVIPALNLTDSILQITKHKKVEKYIERDTLCRAQTPQGFNFTDILRCHKLEKNNDEVFTDDSALMHKYNIPIAVISGEGDNIKITFKEGVSEYC